jgi:ribonuclease P protein component
LRFVFTKADRILKRPEFLYLSKHGNKIYNQNFVALFHAGQFERTRLGITVSRKVGNAAVRNKIKRFAREYFRLNKHLLAGCWDINITAKRAAADLSFDQAFLSLKDIFNRISRSRDY